MHHALEAFRMQLYVNRTTSFFCCASSACHNCRTCKSAWRISSTRGSSSAAAGLTTQTSMSPADAADAEGHPQRGGDALLHRGDGARTGVHSQAALHPQVRLLAFAGTIGAAARTAPACEFIHRRHYIHRCGLLPLQARSVRRRAPHVLVHLLQGATLCSVAGRTRSCIQLA